MRDGWAVAVAWGVVIFAISAVGYSAYHGEQAELAELRGWLGDGTVTVRHLAGDADEVVVETPGGGRRVLRRRGDIPLAGEVWKVEADGRRALKFVSKEGE